MNIHKELLRLNNHSPMKISIFMVKNFEAYWHQSIELIYVLSGRLEIQCGSAHVCNLHEDDIILINMFDVHTLKGFDCMILSFQIDVSLMDSEFSNLYTSRFDCNSSTAQDKNKFIPLKKLLASIVKSNITPDDNVNLINRSYVYKLFYILSAYFKVEDNNTSHNSDKNYERMKNILNYINKNYNQKISLNDLSDEFYLSIPYISKIFKDFTSLSFSEYLTEIRLSHAAGCLSNLNYSIEYVAEKNGFSNARAFVTAFKNKYNCLPSRYRKTLESPSSSDGKTMIEIVNYLDLHHNNAFNNLVNYLDSEPVIERNSRYPTTISEIRPVDIMDKSSALKHTFKNVICVGKAKHILNFEIKNMLTEMQKEIGFKYVRFHGLLDDDMMLYSEDEQGNVELCFTYIDLAIDYLLSINLKPFMELSFMPKELAQEPSRTMFYINSVISLPKSMDKWTYLIKNLVSHLILRYGQEEVESWPFFLWNEPDLINMFGFEDKDEFFNFYKETFKSVKEISPRIAFGSPPVFSDTMAGLNDWMDSFLEFCSTNCCMPDYLTMHFYPMNLSGRNPVTLSRESHLEMQKELVYSSSENALNECIEVIIKRIKKYNFNSDDLYLIGWNSSISHNELLSDTAYQSSYVAKNILENYDSLASFGYWHISDFTEEVKTKNELFHGGQGIFTYNGIKKPHYFAFKMLNSLGDRLIKKGNGFFITKQNDCIQILLYNYHHYSKLYGSGELFDMTSENRYAPFVKLHISKMI
ncbi:MAG: helix-turn-helix domain-containing protein, partial [Clostridium sp.]|nr:helix-turn-helix domain-containing protein [Clostridium sp.]